MLPLVALDQLACCGITQKQNLSGCSLLCRSIVVLRYVERVLLPGGKGARAPHA